MNTTLNPPQGRRLLKPSEAFARLQQVGARTLPAPRQQVQRDWFALNLAPGLGLLISDTYPKETLDAPALCTVPFGPDWLAGFLNVRSQITPVIELEGLFAEVRANPAKKMLPYVLLLGQGSEAFAVILRQFPYKLRLSEERRLQSPPPLPARLQDCVGAIYQQDGLWCEWDIARFARSLS